MKHIHHILCALTVSLGLIQVEAQVLVADTLQELVVTADLGQHSVAYRSDTISAAEMISNGGLVEALRFTQPIYIKDYGPGGIANLTMRGGSSQQVELFWNGMSINSPTLGLTDVSLVPTAFFSEASVHRGSASLLDGIGGTSGALHLNSSADSAEGLIVSYSFNPTLEASVNRFILSQREGRVTFRTAVFGARAEINLSISMTQEQMR